MKRVTVILSLTMLFGCSAYLPNQHFTPHPLDIKVAAKPSQSPNIRALISITGIRRMDEEAGLPMSVEIRFRIENDSDQAISFNAKKMQLLSANLKAFDSPILDPAKDKFEISPRNNADWTALFPFPSGVRDGFDLKGLNLKWSFKSGENVITESATFERERYHDTHTDFRFHYGIGYGYPHRYCW